MSTKHTPGPCEIVASRPWIIRLPEKADGGVGNKYIACGGGNGEANARHIMELWDGSTGVDPAAIERPRLALTIPMWTCSEKNRHESKWIKAKRTAKQKEGTVLVVQCAIKRRDAWTRGPLVVTLCRVAPGTIDTDNLQRGLSAVRDGIAAALDRGDAPKDGIEWRYSQRKFVKPEPRYSVEIAIYSVEEGK